MRRTRLLVASCVAALAAAAFPAGAAATTGTFTASGPNAVPGAADSGPAAIYPWNVVVSGLPGLTNDVNVTLSGLTHASVTDIDALLVAPNGAGGTLFMSDVGDATATGPIDVTFDDSAAANAPVGAPLTAGTYRPTNGDGGDLDAFGPPAPAGPYGGTLSFLNGFNPNGTWSLYLTDDDGAVGSTGAVNSATLTVSTNASGNPGGPANPPTAGPKPKKAKKAKKKKKCKPKRGRGTVGKKPKKCKPKRGRPHR